jgi:hypothetical protein
MGPTGGPATFIYVVRRGWHVDVGLAAAQLHAPLVSVREWVPSARYLLFGFGDKHYLLSHASSFDRLLGALFPGEGLVMLTGLEKTPEAVFGADEVVRLSVSAAQELDLEAFVWKTFATENDVARELGTDPDSGTLYYASVTRYSGLHTCNTWAAQALRAAGLPVHTWGVEFSSQVWSQVKKISQTQAMDAVQAQPR